MTAFLSVLIKKSLAVFSNTAARLLTNTIKRRQISPVLASLHWLQVHFRIHLKILVLTFRAQSSQALAYIADFLDIYTSSRSLRSAGQTASGSTDRF